MSGERKAIDEGQLWNGMTRKEVKEAFRQIKSNFGGPSLVFYHQGRWYTGESEARRKARNKRKAAARKAKR